MSRYSNHNIDRRGKERMKNTNKILVIKYATTNKMYCILAFVVHKRKIGSFQDIF